MRKILKYTLAGPLTIVGGLMIGVFWVLDWTFGTKDDCDLDIMVWKDILNNLWKNQ
jgi:hypothetical protein